MRNTNLRHSSAQVSINLPHGNSQKNESYNLRSSSEANQYTKKKNDAKIRKIDINRSRKFFYA